jgi:hypothetical protein
MKGKDKVRKKESKNERGEINEIKHNERTKQKKIQERKKKR